MQRSCGKTKCILLPRNYLKFPLVKVIVRKIAYKSLITTKNVRFLRMDHRNVVHENFFRGLGDMICTKHLFKPIRVINRTNSWAIWTRTTEDIDHLKKNAQLITPIGLNKFLIHIISPRPLKNFHGWHFDGSSSENERFW